MARVKLDEDLAPAVASPLEKRGHEVLSVVGQGWSGITDEELLRRIREEGIPLITADKGFGDVRICPPGTHPGIVLLRPDVESLREYVHLLELLLESHDLDSLVGTLAVVTSRGVRIRRQST